MSSSAGPNARTVLSNIVGIDLDPQPELQRENFTDNRLNKKRRKISNTDQSLSLFDLIDSSDEL